MPHLKLVGLWFYSVTELLNTENFTQNVSGKITFRLPGKNVRNGHSVCRVVESGICVTVTPFPMFSPQELKGAAFRNFSFGFCIYKPRATKEIEIWAGLKNKFGSK